MATQKLPDFEPVKQQVGVVEIMFLLGMLILFVGLWLQAGLGLAMTVCGAILVLISTLSAWWSAQPVKAGGVNA